MRLLYQEIPAVSEGRARADLRVLVLQTLSHDHVEDRKRRSLAEMRAVVLRTLSHDHVEVRKRSAFADLRVLALLPMWLLLTGVNEKRAQDRMCRSTAGVLQSLRQAWATR